MDHRLTDVTAELQRLEVALARRDEAALPGGYEAVLDDEFEEVGRSGRVWTREAILEALGAATPSPIDVVDLSVVELAAGAWLVRYDTIEGGSRTHRSSIWVRSDRRLRVRFHQGTPAANPTA